MIKSKAISKTHYHSWKSGELAEGCKRCVKGEKLVLFATGLCPARCDFCPVSDRKLYRDVVYANERPLKDPQEFKAIIEEAKACSARGAGITGGDPLVVVKRTAGYIRLLKKAFGKKFHIHLYTPLNLVDEKRLHMLHSAGLDEIRFHLKVDDENLWPRLSLAKKFSWDVGVEIPALPGKEPETRKLIDFVFGKIDFLNLNELELADNAVWRKAEEKGALKCKDNLSYAIKGSDELGKRLLAYAAKKGITAHYCTCKLKDSIQLARRIKRRALNARQKFDIMTPEGMLVRGAIYLPGLAPGFGYHEKIMGIGAADKRKSLNRLKKIREELIKGGVKPDLVVLDREKVRLITSAALARKIANDDVTVAVVKEYPTYDSLELEVEFI
jgi:uncharacterized protein